MKDPIVEEVRKARRKHAERFNFDLHAICVDLKKKEKKRKLMLKLKRRRRTSTEQI